MLDDPVVWDLARRVELYLDPEMDAMHPSYAARVEVQLKSGSKLEAWLRDAHGSPADPCNEGEVREKFRCLAASSFRNDVNESILNVVGSVEQLPSLASLSVALRGDA